ncbi:MAG: hypothetical protein M1514_00895, partial [Patescibacteria group bacterium]|nr:hypothetical protein [Patescibacteria group bacterium]
MKKQIFLTIILSIALIASSLTKEAKKPVTQAIPVVQAAEPAVTAPQELSIAKINLTVPKR